MYRSGRLMGQRRLVSRRLRESGQSKMIYFANQHGEPQRIYYRIGKPFGKYEAYFDNFCKCKLPADGKILVEAKEDIVVAIGWNDQLRGMKRDWNEHRYEPDDDMPDRLIIENVNALHSYFDSDDPDEHVHSYEEYVDWFIDLVEQSMVDRDSSAGLEVYDLNTGKVLHGYDLDICRFDPEDFSDDE